jgi:hypothetical protein
MQEVVGSIPISSTILMFYIVRIGDGGPKPKTEETGVVFSIGAHHPPRKLL